MAEESRAHAAGGSAIAVIMAAALLSMFDRATMPPMLEAMADGLGTSIGSIGTALTVFSIAYAASQLPWSIVSGRLGQIRVLRIALGIGVVAAVVTAVAVDPVLLWVGRVLAGLAIGAIVPAALVFVGDTVPTATRARTLANLATVSSLGMTAAVVVASVLGSVGAWRWVFVVTAVAEAVVLVLLLRIPAGPRPSDPRPFVASLRRVLADRWVLLVFALVALEGAMLFGVMGYLPTALSAAGAAPLLAGVVTGLYGIAVVLTAQLMKPVLGRVSPAVLLAVGGGAIAVAFGLVAVATTLVTVLVASGLLGVAWAAGHTQLQHWMTEAVARDRPVGTAAFSTSLWLGGAGGAAVGAAVAVGGSFPALFAATAAAAVLFAVVAALGRHRYARAAG